MISDNVVGGLFVILNKNPVGLSPARKAIMASLSLGLTTFISVSLNLMIYPLRLSFVP